MRPQITCLFALKLRAKKLHASPYELATRKIRKIRKNQARVDVDACRKWHSSLEERVALPVAPFSHNWRVSRYSYRRWLFVLETRGVALRPMFDDLVLIQKDSTICFLFQRPNAALAKPLAKRAGNLVTASSSRMNRPSRLTGARIWPWVNSLSLSPSLYSFFPSPPFFRSRGASPIRPD